MGVENEEDTVDGFYSEGTRDQQSQILNRESNKMAISNSSSLPCSQAAIKSHNAEHQNPVVPITVLQISKDLSFDIVYHVSRLKKRKPSSKHAATLRRTVNEMSEKHDILFNGMVHKLQIGPDNASEIFHHIAKEIFKDGQVNWGRIVSLYAFAARVAKHLADTHKDEIARVKYVDKIASVVGKYIGETHGMWINNQGGWDSFDEHFPEQHSLENVVWKGLLVTAFGLGALATFVSR